MQIVKLKEGRPTVLTPEVVNSLVAAFQRGFSDTLACQYARISRDTFYRHYKSNELFKQIVDDAKNLLIIAAHNNIYDCLVDDEGKYPVALKLRLSMWILERKEPEQFGTPGCRHCAKTKSEYLDHLKRCTGINWFDWEHYNYEKGSI